MEIAVCLKDGKVWKIITSIPSDLTLLLNKKRLESMLMSAQTYSNLIRPAFEGKGLSLSFLSKKIVQSCSENWAINSGMIFCNTTRVLTGPLKNDFASIPILIPNTLIFRDSGLTEITDVAFNDHFRILVDNFWPGKIFSNFLQIIVYHFLFLGTTARFFH